MSVSKKYDLLASQLGKGGLTMVVAILAVVIGVMWGKAEYAHLQEKKECKQELIEAKKEKKEETHYYRLVIEKLDSLLHVKTYYEGKQSVIEQ